MTTIEQETLISHRIMDKNNDYLCEIINRIKKQGDKPYVTTERQLELLGQLDQFDFGRFLLRNQGINGYWTHYILMHAATHNQRANPPAKALTELEDFILNAAPTTLATQQRFKLFLKENQQHVQNGAKLACVPCGMMGELLYLEFDRCENIKLVGLDYDPETLKDARTLAQTLNLESMIELKQCDAWSLEEVNEFDLISSNGLSIYESDDAKVVALYTLFYKALKKDGTLVTSFLTPPPTYTEKSEWDMSQINQNDLFLQRILFMDIINVKFQCYRTTAQVKRQLELAGFKSIQFIYDNARLFPTVVARKSE